jgi:hypothetical protein
MKCRVRKMAEFDTVLFLPCDHHCCVELAADGSDVSQSPRCPGEKRLATTSQAHPSSDSPSKEVQPAANK